MKREDQLEKTEQAEPLGGGVPYWMYWLSMFLVACISVLGLLAFQHFFPAAGRSHPSLLTAVDQAYLLINESYLGEVDHDRLIDGAIEGMSQAVEDPYTDYLAEEEANINEDALSGNFQGIGAEVTKEGDYVKIVAPISGSPADQAGLQPNDLILAVNGQPTNGLPLNEVVGMIRGSEGTEVTLTIQRGELEADVNLVRASIPIETVDSQIIDTDSGIGLIKITKFNEDTTEDLIAQLKDFESQDVDRVIFDVRQNPGGLLDAAVEISNIFVPAGDPIMAIEDTQGQQDQFTAGSSYGDYKFEGQAVLLIDEGSASASEILAGAMKSQDIPLIGQQSFGKGTVQSLLPLANDGHLKMTTARWLTAEGEWIHDQGIAPDQEVDQPPYSQLLWIDSSQTYQQGMRSDEVKNINAVLRALDYDAPSTDLYTQETTQAVQSFQADQGLEVDGQVSGATANALMDELREKIENNDRQLEAAVQFMKE